MKTGKIDMALIIVFLTGLAYASAYAYELSYQKYYQLPTVFIDLNATTLTSSLLLVAMIAMMVFIISTFVTSLFIKPSDSFFENIPMPVFLVGSVFILLFALFIGDTIASQKEKYMVLKQKEELFVVVLAYKDNLVIAPLDIKRDTIKPKFQTIEMKDAKDTEVINFEHGIKVDKARSSKELKKEMK